MEEINKILILDNIRSAQNVGSVFRTSDAIGIDKVYLAGITPDPIDRFGRKRKDIAKASLGGEDSVSWEHTNDVVSLVKDLKEKGFVVVSLEQTNKSIDYKTYSSPKKIAVVIGNEVEGVSKNIIELSDKVLEIPMKGKKESLNVSVSAGILLYRLFDI